MPPKKQSNDDKKRKAETDANGIAAPARPKKMSKEEKAEARERARATMTASSPASAPASSKKKKAPPTGKAATKPAPKRSPKRTAKSTTTTSTSTKVTIAVKEEEKSNLEMPLPPTSLQRTQSTPLELEIQHQVIENLKADMENKEPVFKEAPPDHLLKFAPKELEEGYDHDESNVGDHDENPAVPVPHPEKQKTFKLNHKDAVLYALTLALWVYLAWAREGMFYHRWAHAIASRVPLPFNPYRVNGRPLPYMPCFQTNRDDPPSSMPKECLGIPLTNCPPFGECWGGTLQACARPYLQVAPNGKSCTMITPVKNIYTHAVNQVSAWTMDYNCRNVSKQKKIHFFDDYIVSPKPYMMVTMRDTTPSTKQPMFPLEYILDLDPFLLLGLPEGGMGRNPIESLYHVVEAANNVADHWLKLQVLTKYGATLDEETGEREVEHVHLVARVPSKNNWWRQKLNLSLSTQCRLLSTQAQIESALRTPWLIGVWVSCMVIFVLWLIVMRYYWKKAQQQQEILMTIETVRAFVLEGLQTSAPKQWRGTELQEHVLQNGPPVEEPLLRQRIWPRVVFDIRGNPDVGKSVIVSGGDLVDVWWWEPRETQAAAEAPVEEPDTTTTTTTI